MSASHLHTSPRPADTATSVQAAPNPPLPATIGGFVNGDTSAMVSGTASLTTTATASSAVASYPITAAQGNLIAANYIFAFVNGALTVTPASITVTAATVSKVYGTVDPTFPYSITNGTLVGTDSLV